MDTKHLDPRRCVLLSTIATATGQSVEEVTTHFRGFIDKGIYQGEILLAEQETPEGWSVPSPTYVMGDDETPLEMMERMASYRPTPR
jgi:hypothetical protein